MTTPALTLDEPIPFEGASASIRSVGVVGSGQMGRGIAQVMAQAGFQVILQDISPEALQRARNDIEKSLHKFVEKGRLSDEARQESLARLCFESDLEALASVDLAVEAILEKEAAKGELFRRLDTVLKADAIRASNTSSISITRLAAMTNRPELLIGLHFMNPVPLMKLVELIRGAQTNDETVAVMRDLVVRLGKTSVMSRDFPGFIANRLLMPLINEAIFALYEGLGSAEDIDTVMTLGMNHPMGPLTLADFIGLDTCLSIMEVLHAGFQDPRFRPCPLLRQHVDAGYLGRKSGRGFFVYDPGL
jgi:3-hydroxybutyryl-CoA dehydrogenase